jgi:hypothetical protein
VWTAEAVLVCALTLLGRSERSFPPIALVDTVPAEASPQVEAYVRVNDDRIYVVTTSPTFRRLQTHKERCGDLQAARKLASVLVHEELHVREHADEKAAYSAQLTTLTALGSGLGTPPYQEVHRAMRAALKQKRPAPDRIMVIAGN